MNEETHEQMSICFELQFVDRDKVNQSIEHIDITMDAVTRVSMSTHGTIKHESCDVVSYGVVSLTQRDLATWLRARKLDAVPEDLRTTQARGRPQISRRVV